MLRVLICHSSELFARSIAKKLGSTFDWCICLDGTQVGQLLDSYQPDILILHGTADEIVPFEDALQFSEDQLIDFIPVEGADHRFRDPAKMELATKQILEHFAL